jgi:Holliday junction resolvasome RuvABC endonuclease subunit
MVQRMLGLAEPPQADAADALALAVTFLHETGRHGLSAPKRL